MISSRLGKERKEELEMNVEKGELKRDIKCKYKAIGKIRYEKVGKLR